MYATSTTMTWQQFSLYLVAIVYLCLSSPCTCQDDDEAVVTTEEFEDPIVEDIVYSSPVPSGSVYFADHFDDAAGFKKKWVVSEAKKEDIDEDIAKYDGEWSVEAPQQDGLKGDLGLVLKSKAKHAAIASRLEPPFTFSNKPLIVQYEVTLQDGQECGGAYLKLLSLGKQTSDLRTFHDKTPYTIMFGPDKCGNDHKLHFIFRHKNPLNGTMTEKHCKKPKDRLEEPFKDKKPHLYTLHLHPDNTFTISLDQKVINEGSLLEDFSPPVNPPNEIEDPDDKKPDDWDEREKIPDPDAQKPDDWDEDAPAMITDSVATMPDGWLDDEPEMVPDPNAEKPDDWDTDMDGEWEAPLIANPVCNGIPGCGPWNAPLINNPAHKGKWRAPLIDNPNYKGKWKPRRIQNPHFFEDKHPFKMTTIGGVGFELWSMSSNILFDNIVITDDQAVADKWAADTFSLKRRKMDKESESLLMRLVRYTNDQPWLWAVYVIVIGLPIVMIIVFCCSSSPQEKAEKKRAAEAKKTDAISPDDEVITERTRAAPASKSQLELPEEGSPEKDEEQEASEGELEQEDEDEEEEEEEENEEKEKKNEEKEEKKEKEEEEEDKKQQEPITEGAGDAPRSPKKIRSRKE